MNTTVLLYGVLAEKFGKEHSFNIKTPAEALQALTANFPEWTEHLRTSPDQYVFFVGEKPVEFREEMLMTMEESVLKIVPVVEGEGGIIKMIIGAAIIYFSGGTLTQLGVSLMISGAAEMMFAPPDAPKPSEQGSRAEEVPNYAFAGPVNTTAVGNCVPVGYGELEVGSQVISAGLSV